jgi:hypothetical protein
MTDPSPDVEHGDYRPTVPIAYVLSAWLCVVVPFGYGVWQLFGKLGPLFSS